MSNTPMLTFIGSSVSYDNLNNFISVVALYTYHQYKLSDSMKYFFLSLSSVLAGPLVKTSFIPLALMFTICKGWEWYLSPERLIKIRNSMYPVNTRNIIAWAFILLLISFNIGLYGGNLLSYGKIVPENDQILPLHAALKNRIFARGWIVGEYRENRMELTEAVKLTEIINHTGDRADALQLLKIAALEREHGVKLMDRIQYAWFWLRVIILGLVSILAHSTVYKPDVILGIYQLIFLAGTISIVRYWSHTDANGQTAQTILLCSTYLFILMQIVNYGMYLKFHNPYVALQGRYVLPVLPMFYGLIVYYPESLIKRTLFGGHFKVLQEEPVSGH